MTSDISCTILKTSCIVSSDSSMPIQLINPLIMGRLAIVGSSNHTCSLFCNKTGTDPQIALSNDVSSSGDFVGVTECAKFYLASSSDGGSLHISSGLLNTNVTSSVIFLTAVRVTKVVVSSSSNASVVVDAGMRVAGLSYFHNKITMGKYASTSGSQFSVRYGDVKLGSSYDASDCYSVLHMDPDFRRLSVTVENHTSPQLYLPFTMEATAATVAGAYVLGGVGVGESVNVAGNVYAQSISLNSASGPAITQYGQTTLNGTWTYNDGTSTYTSGTHEMILSVCGKMVSLIPLSNLVIGAIPNVDDQRTGLFSASIPANLCADTTVSTVYSVSGGDGPHILSQTYLQVGTDGVISYLDTPSVIVRHASNTVNRFPNMQWISKN